MSKSIALILLCVFTKTLSFQCPASENYPDPTNCKNYYECVNGEATNKVCPEGEMYNKDDQICKEMDTCSSIESSSETVAFQCPEISTYPYPGHCENYYECINGGAAVSQICPEGELYDKDARICAPSAKVTCSGTDSGQEKYKVVCYFTSGAGKREGNAKFTPSQIDPYLCTHINYAYAILDTDSHNIQFGDPDVDEDYVKEMMELEDRNLDLKVMLSLGGRVDSIGTKYSDLAADETERKKFNSNAVEFLKKYGFDGLDFDWEYPGCYEDQCADKSNDKENFATWLQELRTLFDEERPRLLLSAAVSPMPEVIDKAYDVSSLASALDFINVMGYGYTDPTKNVTGPNAPLFESSLEITSNLNVAAAMEYWQNKGVPPKKLNMGFPAYGVSFTLENSESHEFGSPAKGPGKAGPATKHPGQLAFFEICKYLNEGWTIKGDGLSGYFAYYGDQWVGYDGLRTASIKAHYVTSASYGGVMIFDISMDDFNGDCCGFKNPLLNYVNYALGREEDSDKDRICN